MRKLILLSSVILFLSCKNKVTDKSSKEKNSDSVKIENLKNINDSTKIQSYKNCDESFDKFLERFGRDSIFQKNRVKYPFKYLSNEYDYDKGKDTIIVEMILNKESFSFIDFTEDKNAMEKEYDKYTVSIENLDSIMNYRLNGYDNGIRVTHKFKLIDGCWYMVEVLDEST